jgi:Alpha galactosidase A/Alpha galactosidase C-terminal beta sandwich domain/Carbohydrate binding module (family 35)
MAHASGPAGAPAPAARRSAFTRLCGALGAALLGTVPLAAAQAAPAAAAPAAHASRTAAHQQDGPAARPYMGWSSWSLESTDYPGVNTTGPASWLTEKHVLEQADVLAAKLKSHGYEYVNVDAGWLGGFDAYGRPLANPKTFPDGIAHVADYVHHKGLKLGSYLAVGLDPKAYGDGGTPIYGAPGCHTKDIVYSDLRTTNGWNSAYKIDFSNPCAQAYIDSVADELAGWGVDLLKLDGVGPGSFTGGDDHDNTTDVAAWSKALKRTGRPIQFVLSWSLSHTKADVWKKYSNGWRVDTDVECYCDTLVTWNNSVKQRWNDVVQWIPDAGPGHWNNLDSLDVGSGAMDGIDRDERRSYMTFWAIEGAPLYSGDDLTKLDDYGLSLLTNDEVIAVDQAGTPARPLSQTSGRQVWFSRQADGSYVVALFDLDGGPATVRADWRDLGIAGDASVRDLWSHRDLGTAAHGFAADLPAHGSRLLRVTPHGGAGLLPAPTRVHGTAATATGVDLAWDASTDHGKAPAGYELYADGRKVATVQGTFGTVQGLAPGTGHTFSVVTVGAGGHTSVPSAPVSVTTPAAGGPATYEAESSANTVAGGATVYGCGACSGGGKVGYLGGGGTVTFENVTAPADGTYLMTVAYVDGDTSRSFTVTVDGTDVLLPVAGSGDNEWSTPQTVTVPVRLKAGANTVRFGNPTDYAPDVDKITL